jgi:hypothetical protein
LLISVPNGAVQTREQLVVVDRTLLTSLDAFNTAQAQFVNFFHIGHILIGMILALAAGGMARHYCVQE